MSSFDTLETSIESSRPIEVYEIVQGSDTYYYTSAEDEIAIGPKTYVPIAISRSEIQQNPENRNQTVILTIPATEIFATQYIDIVPGQKATVSIFRLQRGSSPFLPILLFKGQVLSVRFPEDGLVAEIAVRSLEAALSRNIPRYTYMAQCNHILYGPGCGVDPSSFQTSGTVTAASGGVLTVSGLSVRPDGYFRGGFVKPNDLSDFRLILAHTGNNITLLLPFAIDLIGAQVTAFAGCDHQFDGDCAQVFDNVINFGGFPYVPTKNPFETGL